MPFSVARGRWASLRGFWTMTQLRARSGGIPLAQQVAEMIALSLLRGHGPGYYHTAGFWRPEILWRDKLDHMSKWAYERRVAELNPKSYRKISQHKLPEKALLSLCGVPTPAFYGFLHQRNGRDLFGKPLRDAQQLLDLIERLYQAGRFSRFCIKRIESWEGKGFEALEIHPSGVRSGVRRVGDSPWLGWQDWCNRSLSLPDPDGLLIEEYLEQHPWYAAFNPSSVNTFRIWVVRDAFGVISPRLAILKFGRSGSLIDNTSAGGITAPVDLDSGILGQAVDGQPTRLAFDRHPDSGTLIVGQRAPLFDSVLATAARALAVFPHLNFAGVDVAVTSEGAAIIELNVLPSRLAPALADIPTARALR